MLGSEALHDPGGKVRLKLPDGVTGGALFSDPDPRRAVYRHLLWRTWCDDGLPFALWIGMNPSTADADVDDPTVRLEVLWTRHRGLAGYLKANVMDYRATDQRALRAPGVEPCSPENLGLIRHRAGLAAHVILAFGTLPRSLRPYAAAVVDALRADGVELSCIGLSKDGSPRHPLYYLRRDMPLLPFTADYGR